MSEPHLQFPLKSSTSTTTSCADVDVEVTHYPATDASDVSVVHAQGAREVPQVFATGV
jgi:hypothetical protein